MWSISCPFGGGAEADRAATPPPRTSTVTSTTAERDIAALRVSILPQRTPDHASLKPRSGNPFSPSPRIYFKGRPVQAAEEVWFHEASCVGGRSSPGVGR